MTTISVIVRSTRQGEKPRSGFFSASRSATASKQQLRETMTEIQIAPVRSSVHIPVSTLWAHYQDGGDVDKGLAELETSAQTMIDDLLWWTTALKRARNA